MPHTTLRIPSFTDARGQSLVEYALLTSLIAAVIAIVLPLLGANIASLFDRFASAL